MFDMICRKRELGKVVPVSLLVWVAREFPPSIIENLYTSCWATPMEEVKSSAGIGCRCATLLCSALPFPALASSLNGSADSPGCRGGGERCIE